MRKILVVAIAVMFVACVASVAQAVGVGFPLDTEDGDQHFTIALEDSYIFDKELDGTTIIDNAVVDSSNAVYVKAGYSFSDYISIYGKLGMQDLSADLDRLNGSGSAPYEVDYEFGPMWGIGACSMYKIPGTWVKIGGDVQYTRSEMDLDAIKLNGVEIVNQNSSSDFTFSEFSASLLLGVDIPLDNEVVTSLSPYVGIRYSTAKAEFGAVTHDTIAVGGRNYTGFSGDLDATDNFGMIAGCDAALWKSFDFNIEGRFADETAMTVGGSYSF